MRKPVYVHPRSLISAFIVRCLDSIIPLLAILKVSRLWLALVAEQTRSYLVANPEDRFSRDETKSLQLYGNRDATVLSKDSSGQNRRNAKTSRTPGKLAVITLALPQRNASKRWRLHGKQTKLSENLGSLWYFVCRQSSDKAAGKYIGMPEPLLSAQI